MLMRKKIQVSVIPEASEVQGPTWSPAGLKQFRHKINCDFRNVLSFDSEWKNLKNLEISCLWISWVSKDYFLELCACRPVGGRLLISRSHMKFISKLLQMFYGKSSFSIFISTNYDMHYVLILYKNIWRNEKNKKQNKNGGCAFRKLRNCSDYRI